MDIVLIGAIYGEDTYLIDNLIQSNNINVYVFNNYNQAREYINFHCVDLIFLDADDETYWEIQLHDIQSFAGLIRVVLVSKNGDAALSAYQYGVWDYLLKPVKKKQLARILTNAIKGN